MDTLATVLTGILLFAGLIAIRVYADKLDRERIRKHVESKGGRVLDIAWNPFGGNWSTGRNARHYDVRYSTHRGRIVTASCDTSMSIGVWWPRDAPPGFSDAIEASGSPAESIQCLTCGAKIPARQTHCPHCGWSYEGR